MSGITFKKYDRSRLAKVADSTAVRVAEKAVRKIGSVWSKFIASISNVINEVRVEQVSDEIQRIKEQIDRNKEVINNPVPGLTGFFDSKKAENENTELNQTIMSLDEKLEEILNKKIEIESKTGLSNDLKVDQKISNQSIADRLRAAGVGVSNKEEVKKEDAPTVVKEEPVVNPEHVVNTARVDSAQPSDKQSTDLETDNLIANAAATIEAVRKMKEENERLRTENKGLSEEKQKLESDNKEKENTIKSMETNLSSLNNNNQTLSKENEELKAKNTFQENEINTLKTENETLKKQIEETLNKHSKEIAELRNSIEPLKKAAFERDALKDYLRKLTTEIAPSNPENQRSR